MNEIRDMRLETIFGLPRLEAVSKIGKTSPFSESLGTDGIENLDFIDLQPEKLPSTIAADGKLTFLRPVLMFFN